MIPRRSVLIVDGSEENRAVLRTALERRGVQIFEAARPQQGLEMARHHHPDLIVLDAEAIPFDDTDVSDGFEAESRAGQTGLIVLGNLRRRAADAPYGEFVAKPYHYAPLIRKIEDLLGAAQAAATR